LTPAGDEVEMVATRGIAPTQPGLRFPVPDSVIGGVVASNAPARTGDMLHDARAWRPELAEEEGTHSWLGAPLSSGGRAFGVLSVACRRLDAFTAEHERLLGSLAALAGAAVRQARPPMGSLSR